MLRKIYVIKCMLRKILMILPKLVIYLYYISIGNVYVAEYEYGSSSCLTWMYSEDGNTISC